MKCSLEQVYWLRNSFLSLQLHHYGHHLFLFHAFWMICCWLCSRALMHLLFHSFLSGFVAFFSFILFVCFSALFFDLFWQYSLLLLSYSFAGIAIFVWIGAWAQGRENSRSLSYAATKSSVFDERYWNQFCLHIDIHTRSIWHVRRIVTATTSEWLESFHVLLLFPSPINVRPSNAL